jgi:hypothetical protein
MGGVLRPKIWQRQSCGGVPYNLSNSLAAVVSYSDTIYLILFSMSESGDSDKVFGLSKDSDERALVGVRPSQVLS